MKIEGTHTFAAPRDLLWSMLLDPEVLARVMPGCEKLEKVGDNDYKGILKIKVGPVQGKFNGDITLSEINAPESYHMVVNGQGAPGFVRGEGQLRLEENGETTVMHYHGDAQVGGTLASVGQRLLDTSAKAIIRQSLEGLGQQVEARLSADTTTGTTDHDGSGTAVSAAPPSQTEFALGVARNFVDELIPAEQREEVMTRGLMILGGLILFRMVTNWWINRLARRVAKIIAQESK